MDTPRQQGCPVHDGLSVPPPARSYRGLLTASCLFWLVWLESRVRKTWFLLPPSSLTWAPCFSSRSLTAGEMRQNTPTVRQATVKFDGGKFLAERCCSSPKAYKNWDLTHRRVVRTERRASRSLVTFSDVMRKKKGWGLGSTRVEWLHLKLATGSSAKWIRTALYRKY